MKLKQLSVFLENRPGALSAPCRILAESGVNIQTFALADTREFGILRLMVREWEKAKEVLGKNGYVVKVTEVLALAVPDRPGGLAEILETIEQAQVNVEYVYAFTIKHQGQGLLVFRFNDPDAAIKALQARNVNVLGQDELHKRLTQ